jgi:GntR family transcriptional repressor for pyruvate dehydrogenase complex
MPSRKLSGSSRTVMRVPSQVLSGSGTYPRQAGSGIGGARLGEQVASLILQQVAGGTVSPGSFLPPEAELAEVYGVSRLAVREALQLLASVGVVSVLHGKGTVVRDESDWDVLSSLVMSALEAVGRGELLRRDLYGVRRILECAAAEMAASTATKAQREAIAEKVATLVAEAASADTPLSQFLETDRDFHDLLAQTAGNQALRQIIRQVHVYVASSWTAVRLGPAERLESARQHQKISDAIVAGNPAKARAAMEAHINHAEREQTIDD